MCVIDLFHVSYVGDGPTADIFTVSRTHPALLQSSELQLHCLTQDYNIESSVLFYNVS